MTRFFDRSGKIVGISLTDNSTWVDFEEDFYNVGCLEYDEEHSAFLVDDVQYLIDQANDAISGVGDFDAPMDAVLKVEILP